MRRAVLILILAAPVAAAEQRSYQRLVLLSDAHIPGRNRPMKEKARADINSWQDADAVGILGDLCQDMGTPEEYAAVKAYLSGFQKPVYSIGGNHDYAYSMAPGFKDLANPRERAEALDRLKAAAKIPDVRYSLKWGRYLLIFMSVDDLRYEDITAISTATLSWLEATLEADKNSPAVIFYHAPLEGTLRTRNSVSGKPRFEALPRAEIKSLLRAHPQVFLWASGHTHIAPGNAHFRHPVNLYDGRVYDVQVPDMDGRSFLSADDKELKNHAGLWSVSLYFYPDKVVVKTYDHQEGKWLEGLTREFQPGQLADDHRQDNQPAPQRRDGSENLAPESPGK